MPQSALKLLVIKSAHVESACNFYVQLGFCFTEEQHGNGPTHYSAPLGDGIFEIYPLPADSAPDTTTRLGFSVKGVGAVVESVSELGTVVAKAKETPWGLRAVVRDPDGRSVELYESTSSVDD